MPRGNRRSGCPSLLIDQTFRAHRGRNDGHTGGHRFVDLQPRAAADAERHNRYGGAPEIAPDIRYRARHDHAGIAFAQLFDFRRRPSSRYCNGTSGTPLPNEGQNFLGEPPDAIDIRQPVHRPREYQVRNRFRVCNRPEVFEVYAGGDIGNPLDLKSLAKALRVHGGNRDHVGRAAARPPLILEHALRLLPEIDSEERVRRVLQMPLPDGGLDVVLKQHPLPEVRNIRHRRQKIAHHGVEFFSTD